MFSEVACSSLVFSRSWRTIVSKAQLVAPWSITSSFRYDVRDPVVICVLWIALPCTGLIGLGIVGILWKSAKEVH